ALIALCALLVSVGFTFTDRDTTFLFEPPTTEELQVITGGTAGADEGGTLRAAAAYARDGSCVIVGDKRRVDSSSQNVSLQVNLAARIDALAAVYGLSPRETEVFTLWITGHGSKYIQEKFVISPATVKTHVRHIYEKCAVHNRAELMCKLEESSSNDGGNALQ
ncbi:MAG: helix-turn-helix transcriptional regulator, partial [Raoultibacter sp.]